MYLEILEILIVSNIVLIHYVVTTLLVQIVYCYFNHNNYNNSNKNQSDYAAFD